jgi:hypothetical protein
MPKVLNCYKASADEIANAVFCGRGGPWGNPFVIGKDGNRDEVCDRFEKETLPGLDVTLLRDRDLLCFCKPHRCHCDPILLKANQQSI